MSQHYFETTRAGAPVTVLLGWDRPMQCFFLVVEDSERVVYSNLDEKNAFSNDLEYYLAKLQELEIEVPLTMFEQVSFDGSNNQGDRHVVYAANGDFQEY